MSHSTYIYLLLQCLPVFVFFISAVLRSLLQRILNSFGNIRVLVCSQMESWMRLSYLGCYVNVLCDRLAIRGFIIVSRETGPLL